MVHQAADAENRLLSAGVDNTELEDEIPVIVVTRMKNRADKKESVVPGRIQKKKLLSKNPDEYHAELPTLPDFIIALSKDAFCEQFC